MSYPSCLIHKKVTRKSNIKKRSRGLRSKDRIKSAKYCSKSFEKMIVKRRQEFADKTKTWNVLYVKRPKVKGIIYGSESESGISEKVWMRISSIK